MTPLLLTNANLITLDARRPRATAMLVQDGRITAVGSDRELLPLTPPTATRLDLAGKTVVPGFCDSHIHFLWYGSQLIREADLVGSKDVPDLLARLSDLAGRSRTGWIRGHGFDQSKMAERRFPTRQELDRVSATRPIIVSRVCGHAAVANSAAISLLSPAQRAAGDESAGLYTENDINPFYAQIPPLTEEEMEQAILTAAKVALRTGITSVQTMLDTPDQMTGYSRLHAKGQLPLRVSANPPYAAVAALHAHGIRTGLGDHRLRFGAAKLFSDGSLGAQTALLAEPYADKPGELGIRIYDPQDLKKKARDAHDKGFQIAIHAIGDQALRETLDAIEYALQGADNRLHRHRVEHASLVPPDCLERLARLQVVVTCQPQFVTSDTWTPDRVGPARTPWAYPFKSLLNAGVPITLSSDCPVEKLDAFDTLAAAVGRHPWTPHETLTVEQALRAYSLGSAYCGHMDHLVGSLEPGKYADFVVLPDDPTKLDAPAIRNLKADAVYVNGQPALP
jgi:predicted amidohydrolase YtcJ